MDALAIEFVDVVEGGVVVTYNDASCAFYDEAVLKTHLNGELVKRSPATAQAPVRKELRA